MSPRLDDPVGLLDRSLAYTCARLATVRDDLLDRPTPCTRWRLADLLAHMEDALDAFTEAAGGRVRVHAGPADPAPVAAIRAKATGLLAAWSRPAPGDVVLEAGARRLDLASPLLVATAALEVTVHGWDVGRATGSEEALPDGLADALLPVARATVACADRGVRFGPPRSVPDEASPGVHLLAYLGRA